MYCKHWMKEIQSSVTCINNYINISVFCRKLDIHSDVAIYCRANFVNECKVDNTDNYGIERVFDIIVGLISKCCCIVGNYKSIFGNLENFVLQLNRFLGLSIFEPHAFDHNAQLIEL